jgi:DNA primase
MAHTALLALDADAAGQEAMLKAASLARKRDTRLRVVPLPQGQDPADVIHDDGKEAMRVALKGAVPFEHFQVERVLASGDASVTDDQDRMLDELRPLFAELPPRSALRMELTEMVSSRLSLKENLAEKRLAESSLGDSGRSPMGQRMDAGDNASPGARSANRGSRPRVPSPREDTERAFLALCLASPEDGARALQSLDVNEHFASDLLRRAARRLRAGDLREPMGDSSGDTGRLEEEPDLKVLMAELVVQAGREESHPAMLEAQRLQLELARVDRQIQRARGQESGDVSELAQHRTEVKLEFDRAYGRVLEETGDREG